MYNFDFNGAVQQVSKYPTDYKKIKNELADIMMRRYLINRKFRNLDELKHREFIIDEEKPFDFFNDGNFMKIRSQDNHLYIRNNIPLLNLYDIESNRRAAARADQRELRQLQIQYERGEDMNLDTVRNEIKGPGDS